MVLNCSPSVRRWRLWPGTLGPCKAWPAGHRLRRQGLDKGQHPGARSTVRSTVRRGWITHFHPLIFQKRRYIFNRRFLRASIADALHDLVPEIELPEDWTFDVVPVGEEFLVGTNLDFAEI